MTFDKERERLLDEIMFGENDTLINSNEAAKIAGFKNTCSFTSWAKNNGFSPTQKSRGEYGRRPFNLYRKSDVLKIADMRNPEKQKDDDTMSIEEAARILGFKNAATIRELSSKNPGIFEKKVILENGKLKKYYSRKNLLEVKELIKKNKVTFRAQRKEIFGLDDEDKIDSTKKYQDGFVIKDTPLIDLKITKLNTIFYKISNNIRLNLCQSTYQD